MKKQDLVALLKSVSVDDLKNAIPMKEKMERLEKRKRTLEKDLASVVKQMESLGMPKAAEPAARAKRKGGRKAKRRRIAQPSLSSLIVEILKEKKQLKINDICDALLQEKNYKTGAKDFKAQIRVMMYRNDKGLFKKAGPGLFKLADDTMPTKKAAKRKRRKTAKRATKKTKKKVTKKKATKKKAKKATKKKKK